MTAGTDLKRGSMATIILTILRDGPLHGYQLAREIERRSEGYFDCKEGTLYPALHKLEQEGWVSSEWRPSENNRRAKFYSLTRAGRKQLRIEATNWDRLATAITALVRLQALQEG